MNEQLFVNLVKLILAILLILLLVIVYFQPIKIELYRPNKDGLSDRTTTINKA